MNTKLTSAAVALAVTFALGAPAAHANGYAADTIDSKTLRELKKVYGEGPYPFETKQFLADKPERLQPMYSALFDEGTRNATLNHVRIGLAAIESGEYERAETHFDAALAQIEAVYANDARAKQARSTWSKEAVKDFKGEPYERAMAYYYRGLLYLRAGDFENARASFLQGEYQNTVGEKEDYKSSFAMLDYLAGWASQCAGDASRAAELFAEAAAADASLRTPSATDDLLVIAELGRGPVKTAGGKSRELLQFERAPGSVDGGVAVTLAADDVAQSLSAFPAGSVSWQAMNRGGRAIQAILDGKAQFKDGMNAVGEVTQTVGTLAMFGGLQSGDADLMRGGAVAGLLGGFMKMAAEAAKPDADTRAWDTLPDAVHFAVTKRPAADWEVRATFAADGRTAPAARLDGGASKCSIAWTRSDSAFSAPGSAPGTTLAANEKKKLQKKYAASDRQFRAALLAQN